MSRSVGGIEAAHSGDTQVSVVIPTFNCANVVGEAVASVLAQTRPPHEVLVIDDGSTDATPAVIRAFGPAVRYVRQANAGPSEARNHGARLASAKWLAFLDADDLWLPDKLHTQLAHASRHGADAVLTGLFWPANSSETLVAYRGSMRRDDLIMALLCRNVLAGGASTLLVRRDQFWSAGGFDSSMTAAEDREFLIRLAATCSIAVVPEPLARRRVGPLQFGSDPERLRTHGEEILRRHAGLIRHRPMAVLTIRQARGRLWQRAGLQHLARGDRRRAASAMAKAALQWPLLADPWRMALNAMLGRLPHRVPERTRNAPTPSPDRAVA